ncbi:uncharacterized protein LOC127283045 [Leptopilina boulardi]|uniref:uncharacterized protein LOC127283045 n=1 Tax=Leptopilina boulardi TaxID=63433 RepID=UPI0021F683CB|nr:uncharacterized protein LOC127283045 [Leptopilina boulardi]
MKILLLQLFAVVSVLGTQVSGYPQERSTSDVEFESKHLPAYEDSVAAASDVEEAYDDGDDSDMFMEPDEMEPSESQTTNQESLKSISKIDGPEQITVIEEEEEEESTTTVRSDEKINPQIRNGHQQSKEQVPASTILNVKSNEPTVSVVATVSQESDFNNKNNNDKKEENDSSEKNLETDSQNFFPSFAELFTNHRLPYTEHQQRYRPNRFLGYFQRDRGNNYQTAASSSSSSSSSSQQKESLHPLLGSGNFGVIRGGTYYPEDKENDEYSIDESIYNPYYHGSGRSRHNYYKNPKPQPVRGGDFFANFRDFADITAPPKSSFSHLSVVYANKNGSSTARVNDQPRNIFETLRMLEEEEFNASTITTTEQPQKKLSQGKRKLMKMKKYQDEKARKSRMTVEPLLALS